MFLIEIAVKNDVFRGGRAVVFLFQRVQGHGGHVAVIIGLPEKFPYFDHVPGGGEGHVTEGEPPLFVDDLEHGIDVAVVEDEKFFRILHGVAVFLKNGDAESVKRIDVAGAVVAGEAADALAHFLGGFVGEGDAEDMAGQDAQFIDEIGEAPGERPCFPGTRAGDDADEAFCGRDGFPLRRREVLQQVRHGIPPYRTFVSCIITAAGRMLNRKGKPGRRRKFFGNG